MILNGKAMNPGLLRTEITFERPVMTVSAGGFKSITSYTEIATVRTHWTNAHGNEAVTAASAQIRQLATVLCRYRADVDEGCTLLKGSERFEIISLDNIQERGEWMELKVKRMVRA